MENIVSVPPTVCQWLLPGENMKKLSGLLTLTNVNMNPKCGKVLGSEMNFILTDCWVKRWLTQSTQQQQPLEKKLFTFFFCFFYIVLLPLSWFGDTSCKTIALKEAGVRLESLIIYLVNGGVSSPVKTVVCNFSIHLQTNLTHWLTHKAAARNKPYA